MSVSLKKIIRQIVIVAVAVLLGLAGGYTVTTVISGGEVTTTVEGSSTLELSDEQVEATVTDEDGEEVVLDGVVTVDIVDGGELPVESEDEDGEEADLGQGSVAAVDTSSPTAFKNATLGNCYDVDGAYGAQCVDLANLFTRNYSGTSFSTCGTGAARGIWQCKEKNAGDDYLLVTDVTELQAGDWVVFNGGTYGHIGMALGKYNNGYVTLLGQNQGGASCSGGGQATNIINKSTSDFLGAFRPKSYVVEEEEEEPTADGEITYAYKQGDYFSEVLVELGLDGGNLWGADGTVAYYTAQLIEQDMLDENGNVKWSAEGIPFTLKVREVKKWT